MAEMTYNGVKLEFDMLNADNMERYEEALQSTRDKIQEPTQYEGKKAHEQLRLQITIIDDFFNVLFGDGTSEKLFGDGNNLRERIEAFGMAASLSGQANDEIKELRNKYSPERAMNRQQRRKQKYNNRTRKWQ